MSTCEGKGEIIRNSKTWKQLIRCEHERTEKKKKKMRNLYMKEKAEETSE